MNKYSPLMCRRQRYWESLNAVESDNDNTQWSSCAKENENSKSNSKKNENARSDSRVEGITKTILSWLPKLRPHQSTNVLLALIILVLLLIFHRLARV